MLVTHGVKRLETAWQSPTNKWFRKVPHCNLADINLDNFISQKRK